jgi:hypothetical protein
MSESTSDASRHGPDSRAATYWASPAGRPRRSTSSSRRLLMKSGCATVIILAPSPSGRSWPRRPARANVRHQTRFRAAAYCGPRISGPHRHTCSSQPYDRAGPATVMSMTRDESQVTEPNWQLPPGQRTGVGKRGILPAASASCSRDDRRLEPPDGHPSRWALATSGRVSGRRGGRSARVTPHRAPRVDT